MRCRLYVWVPLFVATVLALFLWPDAARAGQDGGTGASRSWPVAGAPGAPRPVLLGGWDPPPEPWAAGHRGVDLGTAPGAEVRAVAGGRVSFAGEVAGRGVVAVSLEGTGEPPLRFTYEPVRPSVEEGDLVTAGAVVGRVERGPFHCTRGCLHWGLLRGETYLDPLSLLPEGMRRVGRYRLLPHLGVPVPAEQGEDREEDREEDRRGGQPRTPVRVMATAASVIRPGSSAAPSSMRRTAASTTP